MLEKRSKGYINLITLSELYYIICRIKKESDEEKEQNLRSFGVKVISLRDTRNYGSKRQRLKPGGHFLWQMPFGAETAIT